MPGVSADVTAESITRDYIFRCLELGMSLDDTQALFWSVMNNVREERGESLDEKEEERAKGHVKFSVIPGGNRRSS